MKFLDTLVYLLCVAGALAGYFLLTPPLSFVVICLCLAFAAWTLFASDNSGKIVLRLGGLAWTMEDFVRGWLITGRTGSGKTQCAINTITFQLFQNVENWGGVCLDQKGLYWEILVKMAAHFGREHDLVLLQTRPPGEDALWRPPYSVNITGNSDVPASTYAKVIVDTAVSLTGGRGGNPFFPTKAQLAIQTGFEVLRHMEAYVTIPNIHRLLLSAEDANAAIETLMNKGDQRSHELVTTFRGYLEQPPEQLGGVQGTLSTYLEFFLNPEISEVFCANEPTFSVSEIDAGKIVCILRGPSSEALAGGVTACLNSAFQRAHGSIVRWSARGDTASAPLGDAPDLSACLIASPISGAGDTIKRQYWIQQNLQKGERASPYRFTIVPVRYVGIPPPGQRENS